MRWGLSLGWLLVVMGLLVGAVHAADPVRSALERGLFAEESDGDLESASKAYLEAVRAQAETREMGATALYRLGEVYRKLGRTADARQMFERLAREFPEQTRWVGLGTARLTELSPKEARKPQDSIAFQENLLQQELLIAEQAAAEVQKRIEIGSMAPMEAVGPKREVLRIQRQMLALKDRATGAGAGRDRTETSNDCSWCRNWNWLNRGRRPPRR